MSPASSRTTLTLRPLAERRIDLLLAKHVAQTPNKVFLSFPSEGGRMTYAETAEAARHYASLLTDAGLRVGDHLGMMLPNGSEWTRFWFGAIAAGIVDVGIHHELSGLMLAHQLRCAKVKAIVCDQASLARVLSTLEQAPDLALETVFLVSGVEDAAIADAAKRKKLKLRDSNETASVASLEPVGRTPQDLMSIRFTSGTTGPAKAATLTMSQVSVWSDYLTQLLQFTPQDRIYAPFPLHHHLASIMGVMGALTAGGECIVDRHFSASRFWSTAVEYKATLGLILDPVVKMLLGRPPSPIDRGHSIRRFYIARPNRDFEQRFGTKLQTAYALTEGSVLSYVPVDEIVDAPNCVGLPNPHFAVRIVDEQDEEVPTGQQGEIVFRPLHPELSMNSYFDDPGATLKALRNFWFHTGDLGSMGADGYLYFFERMGDTIRRKGVNIPSFHIEEIAMAFPGVREAAAIGIPSAVGEFEIKLCIGENGDGQVSPERLIRWMATQLPLEMVPRYLEIKQDFDRTMTQKILKRSLKQEGITPNTIATDAWLKQ
jgi:crotonobetaine/carnitine-CoA ligase